MSRRPRGRPTKGSNTGKTATFSTRITPELRSKLEISAEDSGLSLSEEIESRLWRSYELEDLREHMTEHLGGEQNYALFRLIAHIIRSIEFSAGVKNWTANPWAFEQVARAVAAVLQAFRPAGAPVAPPTSKFSLDDRTGEAFALSALAQLSGLSPGERFRDRPRRGGGQDRYSDIFKLFPSIREGLGELAERIKP